MTQGRTHSMSELGQKRRFRVVRIMSAIAPIAARGPGTCWRSSHSHAVGITSGAGLGGCKFMPCLIQSRSQPASNSARARIAKTRIGCLPKMHQSATGGRPQAKRNPPALHGSPQIRPHAAGLRVSQPQMPARTYLAARPASHAKPPMIANNAANIHASDAA